MVGTRVTRIGQMLADKKNDYATDSQMMKERFKENITDSKTTFGSLLYANLVIVSLI